MSKKKRRGDPWGDEPTLPGSGKKTRRATIQSEGDDEPSSFEKRLAKRLKETYTLERRLYETRRDGVASNYRPSKMYDGRMAATIEDTDTQNTWIKVARRLHAKRIDPVDYVAKVFGALEGQVTSPPTPPQLLSARSMDLYQRASTEDAEMIQRSLAIQAQTARREIVLRQVHKEKMHEATMQVILDTELALSALFRYCLACSMKRKSFRRIAEKHYKEAAALQYMHNREAYDKYWGDYVPQTFRVEAEQLYEGMIS